MTQVSITELKANLSRYLREVRRGGEIQVLDRGVPVARLTRLPAGSAEDDKVREELIRGGLLRPGKGRVRDLLQSPPLNLGSSIADAMQEERGDRF